MSVGDVAAPARARGGRWDVLRYEVLLRLAARSPALGRAYGTVCAEREWAVDPERRARATERIARVLGVGKRRAATIYRRALESEAREEAEVAWLMRHLDRLPSLFAPAPAPPEGGPCIWATLHLGSPILAILYLARVRGIELQIVGRPLDDANPMPPSKRRWGERKVAWVERVTGAPFLGVSAEATARARARVLEGASLFVLMDVPGDVVARSVAIDLGGGVRIEMAAGIFVLAGLLRVPVRPIVAVSRRRGVEIRYGGAIEPLPRGVPADAIAREMGALVRDLADEWWMWPYMPEAR